MKKITKIWYNFAQYNDGYQSSPAYELHTVGQNGVSPDYIDRNGIAHWKENSISETSKVVMQFTGLSDKNGVPIYEGDILKTWSIDEGSLIHKVSYRWAGFVLINPLELSWPLSDYKEQYLEVIGNVYQNSDLLK